MSNKKASKFWHVIRGDHSVIIQLVVTFSNWDNLYYYANITGASPAYIEQTIEELNLAVNELEYNLSRIPVQVCAS